MSLRPLPRPAPPPPPLFFRGGCPSTGGPAVCVSPAWRSVVKTHLRGFQSQSLGSQIRSWEEPGTSVS